MPGEVPHGNLLCQCICLYCFRIPPHTDKPFWPLSFAMFRDQLLSNYMKPENNPCENFMLRLDFRDLNIQIEVEMWRILQIQVLKQISILSFRFWEVDKSLPVFEGRELIFEFRSNYFHKLSSLTELQVQFISWVDVSW